MDTSSYKRKHFSPCPGEAEHSDGGTIGLSSSTSLSSHLYHNGKDPHDITISSKSKEINKTPHSHHKTKRARASTSTKSTKEKDDCNKATTVPKKRGRKPNNGDIDDITRDLAEPPDEVNLREVQVAKAAPNVKQHELAPVRGGTMLDLDLEQAIFLDSGESALSLPIIREKKEHDHTNIIVVPSFASWFDYHSINPLEKRALPEFFSKSIANQSKTPEIYLAFRNFIIDTYRLNPMEYLTVTACQRHLSGDICAIMRIHALLEQWGIINYQMEPEPKIAPETPNSTNHFHLLAKTQVGLKPLGPDGNPQNGKPSRQATIQMFNSELRESDTFEEDEESRQARSNRFGLRLEDYSFLNMIFQSRGAATLTREWTEDETLSLLEAIELFKDDWHKVSEHVGNRTQDECILHFLRLPIEDPFLVEDESTGPVVDYQPIPFSKSGNPIMSTLAFLASVVDPKVAASAAKAALKEFSKLADTDAPKDTAIDEKSLSTAASSALNAAANTSKHLALIEERKIKSLVTVLVDTQLKKLDIKMKHFEELDTITEKEKETIENQRKQLKKEQQEFENEQVRAANFRARQIEVQNMINPEPPGSTSRLIL
ncbi:SWI SNF complex subunit SMARCC2 isoform X2 [Olea europaea subsp. europaea]|uniref:SWI SNF complex subunit SMARCC2 isoform X2 n=1 Tax=Olea europaea subsp. europaea TaxID=158383 RepID=A0A8S0TRE3_OLEEU|nr:SWI SNF complex subunit SMARCC2 isoform X2 [Olea europaea subsp. europaea]